MEIGVIRPPSVHGACRQVKARMVIREDDLSFPQYQVILFQFSDSFFSLPWIVSTVWFILDKTMIHIKYAWIMLKESGLSYRHEYRMYFDIGRYSLHMVAPCYSLEHRITPALFWLLFHTIKLVKLNWLHCVCNWMGAHVNRKVDTKAWVLLQMMPPMQDGCTTALGVFAVDFNSRRRSQSVIHPCLMSSFSTASLSWSDGGRSMLRWCAVRCTISKPTTVEKSQSSF